VHRGPSSWMAGRSDRHVSMPPVPRGYPAPDGVPRTRLNLQRSPCAIATVTLRDRDATATSRSRSCASSGIASSAADGPACPVGTDSRRSATANAGRACAHFGRSRFVRKCQVSCPRPRHSRRHGDGRRDAGAGGAVHARVHEYRLRSQPVGAGVRRARAGECRQRALPERRGGDACGVNPTNPSNVVAFWQQDRWNDGRAHGNLAGYSLNGGQDVDVQRARVLSMRRRRR